MRSFYKQTITLYYCPALYNITAISHLMIVLLALTVLDDQIIHADAATVK